MEASPTRSKERKGSGLSQAAASLSGGSKPSLSRSEEFLAQISTELTDEALFVAGYRVNPVPSKEKQTQDQETQIYKQEFFTKTQGTDTCSDRNHACTRQDKVPQAMGTVTSLTEAATSKVHDGEQRQIQLTTSHSSCPPGSDSSAFGTFDLSQLVLEAASSSIKAWA